MCFYFLNKLFYEISPKKAYQINNIKSDKVEIPSRNYTD